MEESIIVTKIQTSRLESSLDSFCFISLGWYVLLWWNEDSDHLPNDLLYDTENTIVTQNNVMSQHGIYPLMSCVHCMQYTKALFVIGVTAHSTIKSAWWCLWEIDSYSWFMWLLCVYGEAWSLTLIWRKVKLAQREVLHEHPCETFVQICKWH